MIQFLNGGFLYLPTTQNVMSKTVPVIEVSGLTKTFIGKVKEPGLAGALKSIFFSKKTIVKAVKDVSFCIDKGELVGFIGPNGAGKSTTIKMLTGILFPTSGEVSVLGHRPQQDRVKLAFRIGTIFGQRQQLWYHLPAIDSFNLFAKIYELDDAVYQCRLKELINIFDLKKIVNQPVRKLSLGQRMRCEFVASLLHNPEVLFLDEPTIGLDIIAKRKMREFISRLNKKYKTTIILTSHDLDDIEELCPRVIVINKGKVLYDGLTSTLRKKISHKLMKIIFDEVPKKLPRLGNVTIKKRDGIQLELEVPRARTRAIVHTLLKSCKIADIEIMEPPIEEVVEELYR